MNAITVNFPNYKNSKNGDKLYLGNKKCNTILERISLQTSFIKEMKKTVYQILNNKETKTRPSIQDIETHFSHQEPNNELTWDFSNYKRIADYPLMLDKITTDEILHFFKTVDNTAPGSDGITYKNLQSLDPECHLLCHLYNTIISTKTLPNTWKSFKTILLPKPDKNDKYHDVSSWRPIALLNSTYKVFTAILCQRLSTWLKFNNLLHQSQKGVVSNIIAS